MLEQVTLMAVAVASDKFLGFGVREVFDALLGFEVKLDPVALVLGVDKAHCVAAEAVHVPV